MTDPKRAWKAGIGFAASDRLFYGSHTEQFFRDGASSMYNIIAAGIVDDARVARVVGTAMNGKTASVTPSNTCWFLVIEDTSPANAWERIEAQDAAGNSLHVLTFR